MHIPQLKVLLAIGWVIALVAAGVLGRFGIAGWTMIGGLAVFPVFVMRQIDSGTAETLSETIRAARR
jgi:hypothetical protein